MPTRLSGPPHPPNQGARPVSPTEEVDLVTGLPRRIALHRQLKAGLRRHNPQVSFFVCDVDGLRHVNHSSGFAVGDSPDFRSW